MHPDLSKPASLTQKTRVFQLFFLFSRALIAFKCLFSFRIYFEYYEGRSFNVVIGVIQSAFLIPFTFRFNPSKYSPSTETHFSCLEIHSVKAEKYPANMYICDPHGQNLGIYAIRVLHGPYIGFFCPYKTHIGAILVKFDLQTCIYGNHMGDSGH